MHSGRIVEHAMKVIEGCSGTIPLHRQMTAYFSSNRSMGGRDRRFCRSLVYSFYRLGHALQHLSVEHRLAAAAWLMQELPEPFIRFLVEKFSVHLPLPAPQHLDERLQAFRGYFPDFSMESIFPFIQGISPAIDLQEFLKSMLIQPLVWIRVRSGEWNTVAKELNAKGITPESALPEINAMSFRSATRLDDLDAYGQGSFEIQDLSSQRVADHLHPMRGQKWWDACAASGGKSLLLLEKVPDLSILATDVRAAILSNYNDRLKRAGYRHVDVKQMDLSTTGLTDDYRFQGILADVPCSGSGTWSRSPEQLRFFDAEKIRSHYVPLQRNIVEHILPNLEADGQLVYVTCSVFSAENEENVNWMVDRFRLEVVSSSYISCYFDRADSMFVAVLRRAD